MNFVRSFPHTALWLSLLCGGFRGDGTEGVYAWVPSKANSGRPTSATTDRIRDASIVTFADDSREERIARAQRRITRAGAGVALLPPGDCRLFDPAVQGKLGISVHERIQQGYIYRYTGERVPPLPVVDAVVADADAPQRVRVDADATVPKTLIPATPNPLPVLQESQHWLEDIGVPDAFAKPAAPVPAKVLSRRRLIADDAPGDVQHIIMSLPKGLHYVEGQSLSVIPPGTNPQTGRPHKPRLYSIASTRYGDDLRGNTVSLCVRRAENVDPQTRKVDPTKAGVCSNFLCDMVPGTIVQVAGPVGKTMLLPDIGNSNNSNNEKANQQDIIMVATGTGIAPFRAFLRRLFLENTVAKQMYQGQAWLILGVSVTGGLLYADEFERMQQPSNTNWSGQLRVDYAISREMKNQQGGKLYVQDVLSEEAEMLWTKLEEGAIIYFCGLKGMMPGILEALEDVAKARGKVWSQTLRRLKANGQWHVEVY
jgi:ferredoxin--NADP+ reductase